MALTLGAFQTLDASLADGRKVDPIESLARALEPKFETPIRIAAAASLAKQAARLQGKLDDPRGVSALAQAAAGDDPELRQMAVYALGFFGGEAASRPSAIGSPAMKIGTCATTRPWRWAGGATCPRRGP